METNELWTEEFRPKSIENYIGNNENVNLIKDWIINHKNKTDDTKKFLILHGSPGVGKTTLAHIIFNEYGYDVLEFNASDQRTKKKIKDKISCIGKYSIINFKEVGLIMDEIDGIAGGDKGSINEFIKIIYSKGKTFKFPVICTCNSIKDKKLIPLLKKSLVIQINKPTKRNLNILLTKIIDKKKININNTDKQLIIKNSNNDYRSLINNIFQYYLLNSVNYLQKEEFELEMQNLNLNDNLSNLEFLLKNNIDHNYLYTYCESNDLFYYLNLLENYLSILKTNKQSNLKNITKILDNYNYCEVLKKFLYNNQYWELNNYITYVGILSNINILKSSKKKYLSYHNKFNLLLQDKSNIKKKTISLQKNINLNDTESIHFYHKIKNIENEKINNLLNKLIM